MKLSYIDKIRKYYKKYPTFLEFNLMNYDGYNVYVTINYFKKSNIYRLSYFDLNIMEGNDIEPYLSCITIPDYAINNIKEMLKEFELEDYYMNEGLYTNIVMLNIYTKTKNSDCLNICFKESLPKEYGKLIDVFMLVFRCINGMDENVVYRILSSFTTKARYTNVFNFDLFNGDIDSLFNDTIIERGKEYYKEKRVNYLEKINDKYIAVVSGNDDYVVIIDYDDEAQKIVISCNCPCEFNCKHIYAVLLAIRNKKFKKFYKIKYKNEEENLLDRILDYDYMLCLGVTDIFYVIINEHGNVDLIPIFDENGKSTCEIIEDDKDKKLENDVKERLQML